MGWLFGIVGSNVKPDDIAKAETLHPQPLFRYKSKNLYLASGGLKQTCLSSLALNKFKIDKGWMVCGLGISSNSGNNWHFLSAHDWNKIFSDPSPELDFYDGHFVAVNWKNNELFAYIDQRGLRDLYITKQNNNFIISTRLDWLCNYGKNFSLDFKKFGSRWLCTNQLSIDSIIHSVTRLGPGGRAKITPAECSIQRPQYIIPKTDLDIPLDELIIQLVTFPMKTGYHVVLSLSGGIDARTVLAALLSRPREEWSVSIFGSEKNPDVKIALKIVCSLKLNYQYFKEEIPDADTCLKLMSDFAAQTDCIAPATDAIRLKFYQGIYKPDNVLIDGGFGEMARCWLFNRLLTYGNKAYASGQLDDIIRYLELPRADIFTEDKLKIMFEGVKEDIENLWKNLPHKNLQNFIDLLGICLFLPNTLSPEQSRIDNLTLSYMPFAQSSYLAQILVTEIDRRKNGIFLRNLILKKSPFLTRFPMVTLLKDSITYPFFLSNKKAILALAGIERLLGFAYHDQLKIKILKKLRPFILDTLSSESVHSFSAYNLKAIKELARRFYKDDDSCAEKLAWWLTFELWRQALRLSV
ncbi:MAG: hypothetical protein N3A65_04445 [candidate division WOR-3 bacterium]|nr:hypothetical protein [candidate division WOR-3 bacterium]